MPVLRFLYENRNFKSLALTQFDRALRDLAIKAVDAAIETHGGMGFVEETGLIIAGAGARLLKTAPVSREMMLN